MRNCCSRAEKCLRVPSECHFKEQGSTMIIDGIRDGLIWNYGKKQMSSIDEREWHVVENADFRNHPV